MIHADECRFLRFMKQISSKHVFFGPDFKKMIQVRVITKIYHSTYFVARTITTLTHRNENGRHRDKINLFKHIPLIVDFFASF